ncbi:MAG: type II secretion system protein [Betaproteobacteria bacterium]|jgi:general secretion pathway protein G|nr:prepilin-type N-terminal cleavage/methylation domain-containing protein [Rhodocyclaceae bacterium]MCA3133752.1 prepilin-type N-terminal cleavage/methylation domain-containing protein [Rhodocyclaceae bacterium]MCA3142758.1 prepilin-type N-terminal cleavage/methylation domain-containing protein [Rhodocyclaceae bacterium]MCA3145624.1 prepilin-type N-terminal cleavage/methylation domain-containing protein [Rhodocyclaceae bacterium]MCE2899138.1 type II secretion system GspH family protein [Betapr
MVKAVGAPGRGGFTLVELLVVMAVVALLLSMVTPRYFASVDRAREAVLKETLATVREAIDKFHADTGAYPASLDELVRRRYLRRAPLDPVTESAATWVVVPAPGGAGGLFDVRSGAPGSAADGTAFSDL